MKDLIERLRNGYPSKERLEAADAIHALNTENTRLTECLRIANNNHEEFERKWYLAIDEQDELKDENSTLKAELAATKEWSCLNNEAAVDMGKQCRELAAELAAMRDQNPFAWYDPSADKFTRDRDDPNMNRGAVLWRLFLDAPPSAERPCSTLPPRR